MTKIVVRRTLKTASPIKQSRVNREWMDSTYNKHAYQCAPMTTANVLGWELSLPDEVRVVWPGGNNNVRILSGNQSVVQAVIVGMVSFTIGWRFKTEDGYSLSISGSPNLVHKGAQPLSAVIPTDWWPDEFQMNWIITEENKEIVFPKNFPFMFFTIVDRRALESVEIIADEEKEDKNFVASRMRYANLKAVNNREKPWSWVRGIKTGIDADGNRIGPGTNGLPKLSEPG